MTVDPTDSALEAEEIEIGFKKGHPITAKSLKDGKSFNVPLAIIEYLNEVGGAHGIGRIDIVENRYIGVKVHISCKVHEVISYEMNGNERIKLIATIFAETFQSRGVYESPGVNILEIAHRDLEVFTLDREVLRIKSYLTDKMSDYVYNGSQIRNI